MTTALPHWTHRFFTPTYQKVYEGPLFDEDSTKQEAAFLAEEFAPVRDGLILDIGCGFGRHRLQMLKKKFRVVGLDRFVHLLQAHPKKNRLVSAADMRQLPFAEATFAGGAYCLFNTFGYFSHNENMEMLDDWSRVIAPGGRLVMQIPNRPVMADIARNFQPSQMFGPNCQITEMYEYDMAEKSLVGRGIWQIGNEEQTWEFRLRLYTKKEIERALNKAGFDAVTIFEDYDRESFNERTSSEMVIVARKK